MKHLASAALLCFAASSAPTVYASWSPNGVPLCVESHYQVQPTITTDGAGGAIVAWTDLRNGTTGKIYAQRVDSSGTVLWNADGVALCTASGAQFNQVAVPGYGGGATVFWQDRRDNRFDIYAQRIDGSGSMQWSSNGIAIATSTVDELYLLAIRDGSGGLMSPPGWIALFTYLIKRH